MIMTQEENDCREDMLLDLAEHGLWRYLHR